MSKDFLVFDTGEVLIRDVHQLMQRTLIRIRDLLKFKSFGICWIWFLTGGVYKIM